ncbi:uncharacterized protein [Vicugna pacos]|uniref:Uncharacterized protein n=1 Tax=Vicugna pacos TaxID=30538 RepID=A0ABM5CWV1_VICPA
MKPVLPRASLPTETPVEAYQWMSHIRASGMIPQTDLGVLGAVPCRCHPKWSICFWEIMLKEMLHLLTLWTWTTLPCPLILVARVHEECKAGGTLIRGGACPSRSGFIAAQTSGILDPFLEQRIEELPQVHVGTPQLFGQLLFVSPIKSTSPGLGKSDSTSEPHQ